MPNPHYRSLTLALGGDAVCVCRILPKRSLMGVLVIVGQLLLLSASLLWKERMCPATHALSYTGSVMCFHRPKPWADPVVGWDLQNQEPRQPFAMCGEACQHRSALEPHSEQVCWPSHCAGHPVEWSWPPDSSIAETSLSSYQWKTQGWQGCELLRASPSRGASPQSTVCAPDTHTHCGFTLWDFLNELSQGWLEELLESLPRLHSHSLLWLL